MYGQSGWRHTPGMPKLSRFDAPKAVERQGHKKHVHVKFPSHAKRDGNMRNGDDSGYSSKHKKAVMNYG